MAGLPSPDFHETFTVRHPTPRVALGRIVRVTEMEGVKG
jgi:hypothetical protein